MSDNQPQWEKQVSDLDQCPQRQDSIEAQLRDLCYIGDKLGFYDATDTIRNNMRVSTNE